MSADTTASSAAPIGQIIRAPKTAELIAGQLRRQIVRGELKAGDTLPPEVGLMEQFGVSRPTLREAFRILETESLISVRRGSRGGARVTSPELSVAARYVGFLLQISGTTIVDVYQARMVIEPPCAALLAKNATKTDVRALRECIAELRRVIENHDSTPDPVQWGALTYRFHQMMLDRCGNKTLAIQGAVLRDIVASHLAITVSRSFSDPVTEDRFKKLIKSYDKLVDLVESKLADEAERHWRSHMEVAGKSLLQDDFKTKTVVELFN